MTPSLRTPPRIALKRVVARVLDACGLTAALRYSHRHEAIILAYHRVLPPESADIEFVQPGMYVTTDTFRAHLAFLKQHYNVVPLDALVACPQDRACAVTFDDGWRDNYVHAFPLLKEADVPATIFLPTNIIGTDGWPWADRVSYYVRYATLDRLEAALKDALQDSAPASIRAWPDHEARVEALLHSMKQLPHDRLLLAMDELDHRFPELLDALDRQKPWMTWDAVAEMARHRVSFGSHTENHVILSNLPLEGARREIVVSRERLSERLQRPVDLFCYPNGYHDASLVELVREAGYRAAVTTKRGFAALSEPLAMNRVLVHDDISSTMPMFACVLTNSLPYL